MNAAAALPFSRIRTVAQTRLTPARIEISVIAALRTAA
jgi:hypothetical protein